MSDLIIHNVPESLRTQLHDVARESGRTPSEEAIAMLAEALSKQPAKKKMAKPGNAWDLLRAAIGEENLLSEKESEEFNKILEESRWAPMRPVPDFE